MMAVTSQQALLPNKTKRMALLEQAIRLLQERNEWAARVAKAPAIIAAKRADGGDVSYLEKLLVTREREYLEKQAGFEVALTELLLPDEAALHREYDEGKPYLVTPQVLANIRAGLPEPLVTVRGVIRDWEDAPDITETKADGSTPRDTDDLLKDWTHRAYDLVGRRDELVELLGRHEHLLAVAEDQDDFTERDRLYQEWLDYLARYELTCRKLRAAQSQMLIYEKTIRAVLPPNNKATATGLISPSGRYQ